jgi:hypothetical protein
LPQDDEYQDAVAEAHQTLDNPEYRNRYILLELGEILDPGYKGTVEGEAERSSTSTSTPADMPVRQVQQLHRTPLTRHRGLREGD